MPDLHPSTDESAPLTLKGDTYTLSSGREFYANNGIVGLSPSDSESDHLRFAFAEGYDGHEDASGWTPEERQELAAFMIALWTAWPTKSL